jgi:pimeloyl-ACP methyl ester carboxylesterase
MPDVQRSRSGLSYFRIGRGNPLLLLHGIPGNAASWLQVADELSADADLIIPDLLGFGASERPRGLGALDAAAQADALSRLIDELGIHAFSVAGHDFGGPVALLLYARRPDQVRHLALFATNAFSETPIPFPLSLATWPVLGKFAASLLFSRTSLRAMLRSGTGIPHVNIDPAAYLGDACQVDAIRTIFAGSLLRLCELYAPVEAQLARVTVPRLVGWGDRDPFFSVAQGEKTAGALCVPLRLYPGAGHFLPAERPREIAADLRKLLEASGSTMQRDPAYALSRSDA